MSKEDTTKRSGRVSFDSRGEAVWEWETAPGVFVRDIDTQRLRTLQQDIALTLEDHTPGGAAPSAQGKAVIGDPRDQGIKQRTVATPRRKSLDDLRRLSEEIKRSRQLQTTKKP